MEDTSVHGAMRQLEGVRNELMQLVRNQPEGWKAAYGRLRPTLDDRIDQLDRVGDKLLQRASPEQRDGLATLVQRFRKAIARHQAKWPVLVINSNNPDYVVSNAQVDETFAELVSFINRLPR